ncbi:hypothetical protein GWN42_31665 [candidate division KSB1 bacterium]|nr:hypothetical protein [candidate division KSB1 bacterium]NIS28329.1 hypothetical protein [candidate division KSB1 bacterium]NIU29056.1 hypothetical protein [candidate division KSB1 bacterium]NIU94428.1 hypothetical protein [candidate division KSB1 bacterium]NIV97227.1 hypothetical protein [candidate division KSB1 bacterium]
MWAFLFTINFGPQYQHYRIKFLFWFMIGIIYSLRRVYKHEVALKQQLLRKKSQRGVPAQPARQPRVVPNVSEVRDDVK